jgi:hypothetical protein
MTYDTTLAAQRCPEGPSPPHASWASGDHRGELCVEGDNRRFRVRTTRFTTQWLPDTPSNRHLTVVWCRLLVDAQGKPLFTLQELATIVGSTNRQAASQHLDDFRQCGADMRTFVLRKRGVNATVVYGVLHELLQTPLVLDCGAKPSLLLVISCPEA